MYCRNIHLKITMIVITFPGIPKQPAKMYRIFIPKLLVRFVRISSSSPEVVPLPNDDVTDCTAISVISVKHPTIKTLTNLLNNIMDIIYGYNKIR